MHLLRPEILIAFLRLNIDLIFVALVYKILRASLDEVIATNYWTIRASMRWKVSELVASPSTSSYVGRPADSEVIPHADSGREEAALQRGSRGGGVRWRHSVFIAPEEMLHWHRAAQSGLVQSVKTNNGGVAFEIAM